MAGNNKKKESKNKKAFINGGLLSDWSPVTDSLSSSPYKGKSKGSTSNVGSQKLKMNAIGYNYPQIDHLPDEGGDEPNKLEESDPVALVDTKEIKVETFVDQTVITESETVKCTYEYSTNSEADDSFHRGLGFCDKEEDDPCVTEKEEGSSISDSSSSEENETDIMDGNASEEETLSSPEKKSGFLSIGGMKLYTRDISDEEDDEDKEDGEESLDSSESGESSNSSDGDSSDDSDSDIDDEIAKDYFEGIGGSYKDANLDISYDKDYGVDYNDAIRRLGGIALQDASREYGKKPRSKKKTQSKFTIAGANTDDWSVVDDLMFVKDPRICNAQKKKHAVKLPQSWPSKGSKSNHSRRLPGEKKKQRQDTIALKRRERMKSRGVDLEKINLKLELMVQNGDDIMSFELMHSRDCSQIQRLASIYHLQSCSQGSGKRRFVTVTRTEYTRMPSSNDRVRLEKLLGVSNEETDCKVNNTQPGKMTKNKSKKGSKVTTGLSPLDSRLTKTKTSGESSKNRRRDKTKISTYATQPMSFISRGNMESEPEVTALAIDESKSKVQTASSSSYGAFEMHTTGFGSRMMAKMGYVDGNGLGKDGTGISEPIQAIQRPKSLGLGAMAPETLPLDSTPPQRYNKSTGRSSGVVEVVVNQEMHNPGRLKSIQKNLGRK